MPWILLTLTFGGMTDMDPLKPHSSSAAPGFGQSTVRLPRHRASAKAETVVTAKRVRVIIETHSQSLFRGDAVRYLGLWQGA